MSEEKAWNDVADQERPVDPYAEIEVADDEEASVGRPERPEPATATDVDADPADVADQHRVVPLTEDDEF
ncbi:MULTISPECIES: hypothetical protein [Saccharothrix]|uniref:Uncharacterized protein n=2 Tax=Saccharothrix TaxID=2071 RepID=A0ABU0WYZ5_9PSEU|nr:MULTISPECIES: hypothetical protein [Saccharothrix]MBY8848754.1 hypothetical protein [Saccharothrix sp. MB29]MDQ2585097.1 hypothetical protein [Saccharothrix yanglingensis]MDR6592794.1 hypothetical protein [Saccharothrix longispora]MDU0294726.1 hypothetical protein [Saccharothrix longispora]